MIRVLMVEDDPVIRETTRRFLETQTDFQVVCAATGEDALARVREKFDVILLDILLPDINGVDLCQRLRGWFHCPIIFTSCLDDTDTIVRALDLGGDDFLSKPYDHKILLARIMANVRRVKMDSAEPSLQGYRCAAFTLDADSHNVILEGGSAHLADMEYRILLFSSATPGPSSPPTSCIKRSGARTAWGMCAPSRSISTTCGGRSSPTPPARSTCGMSGAKAISLNPRAAAPNPSPKTQNLPALNRNSLTPYCAAPLGQTALYGVFCPRRKKFKT